MRACRGRKGIKSKPSSKVRLVLCVLYVFHDAIWRRGDIGRKFKIEGVLEASSLSQVIGFFIAWNILMRGHVVPFQNSLVCIYGVQKRVLEMGVGNRAYVGHPSPCSLLAGPACGPFENPITVCDDGDHLVTERGERRLYG